MRHIFNAAEPVDADVIKLFLDTFEPLGLSRSAMTPGYGLAEHTVYVCDGGKQVLKVSKTRLEVDGVVEQVENDDDATTLVGCGFPHRHPESEIRVVVADRETCALLGEDSVGEIWVSSPSAARAYFGLEEKSRESLQARLACSEGEDKGISEDAGDAGVKLQDLTWMRSGDLGFLHDGELFICGRIKDLVIIRGRNHYPKTWSSRQSRAAIRCAPGAPLHSPSQSRVRKCL